ncbi:hypothetical protein ACFU5O_13535 [Streptomyces sp. NPDC057445]|uniref:hypothetical protein n=1 Tax=Streptomyces sp. NPDC057445 TaxID=3346136 RepID=UPI00368ACADD
MGDEQVVHLAGRHRQGSATPDTSAGLPRWPEWRADYPTVSPDGHPFLMVTLRMTAPSGRHWQQHRLVENHRLRERLAPILGALPMSHSLLQEPHGGQHCRYSDRTLQMWQETDPARWPNTLYRQLAEEDGPRQGLGEVTVTLHLETRDGHISEASRTISECNIRADGRLLLAQLPQHSLDTGR